jgi:hypothetical protein
MCCLLLALVAVLGGSGVRASVPEAGTVPSGPAAVERTEVGAQELDARFPFLAAGGLLNAPIDLPTRVTNPVRTRPLQAFGGVPSAGAHSAVGTALRLRLANAEHAGVASMLVTARAGRAELHATPPPHSVS